MCVQCTILLNYSNFWGLFFSFLVFVVQLKVNLFHVFCNFGWELIFNKACFPYRNLSFLLAVESLVHVSGHTHMYVYCDFSKCLKDITLKIYSPITPTSCYMKVSELAELAKLLEWEVNLDYSLCIFQFNSLRFNKSVFQDRHYLEPLCRHFSYLIWPIKHLVTG